MEIRSSSNKRKPLFALIGSLAILSLGLIVLLLPVEVWESGTSLCLSKAIFGCECLGCGLTRAISSALHLQFGAAFAYNPLIVVVFPLLCLIIGKYLWRNIKIMHLAFHHRDSKDTDL
ncbi:MAG: DUF2752 domain-containing protein [Candidatus Cloacimonetes bacterium]|nr:DUF2752 domain-containing protein [Candidatus Cloacimonadota bacterium]